MGIDAAVASGEARGTARVDLIGSVQCMFDARLQTGYVCSDTKEIYLLWLDTIPFCRVREVRWCNEAHKAVLYLWMCRSL